MCLSTFAMFAMLKKTLPFPSFKCQSATMTNILTALSYFPCWQMRCFKIFNFFTNNFYL